MEINKIYNGDAESILKSLPDVGKEGLSSTLLWVVVQQRLWQRNSTETMLESN